MNVLVKFSVMLRLIQSFTRLSVSFFMFLFLPPPLHFSYLFFYHYILTPFSFIYVTSSIFPLVAAHTLHLFFLSLSLLSFNPVFYFFIYVIFFILVASLSSLLMYLFLSPLLYFLESFVPPFILVHFPFSFPCVYSLSFHQLLIFSAVYHI